MSFFDRLDKYWIGILLGLALPALFLYTYTTRFHLDAFFRMTEWMGNPVAVKLLSLSVFPNMAALFLFYTMDVWRLSKGVLIGAFPYILAALVVSCG